MKARADGAAVPSSASELATPSTTFPVGSLSSSTVNVAVPPDSVVASRIVVEVDGDTAIPAVSSSSKVRVAFGGSATPLPPAAVPDTVTDLSGASTSFPFAVTVTAPVLAVEPAAMVSVLFLLKVKSPDTAGATVTVTASPDAFDSVAVTVETPPVSVIELGVSTSDTLGWSSSSRVRVAFGGFATPLPPAAVPETVTDLFGDSTSFPFAVTVTVPVLAVAPAAMVRVVVPERVKSPDTAPVEATAAAATVTVTALLDTPDNRAVTVATPPVSVIELGVSTSDTLGRPSSSSRRRNLSDGSAAPLPPVAVPETVTHLFPECA